MNKIERREVDHRFLEVYCGILFNSREFEQEERVPLLYKFDCPEFAELKARWPIEQTAGRGGDFVRGLRLARWLSRNLNHKGDFSFTAALSFDSLTLLDYGFGKKEHGMNCAAKAKILEECCLSLGIYARTVGLYPASPYDSDNHVVVEIFDREKGKWIMLDPTTGGYVSAGGEPLSCFEMREAFAQFGPVSVVLPRQSGRDLPLLAERNVAWNSYYAKNCYFFTINTVSEFGTGEGREVHILPCGFDCRLRRVRNAEYMLENAKKWNWGEDAIHTIGRWVVNARTTYPLIGSPSVWDPPVPRA